ncbi:MAG: hypothetical protein HFI05_00205 [Lachnospiraceae bacterium]|jgi:hypothetical protein|nr:hypothetical protein [Lachnospiraceae bacterium]
MKKLSRNIYVSGNVVYKKKSKIYLELPKNYKVKYYLYNMENEIYIGVIKKIHRWWIVIILIGIMLNIYLYIGQTSYTEYLNIPDKMYCSNGIIELNIVNRSESEKTISINLYNNEDKKVIETVYLDIGASIGNVELIEELPRGSYIFTLKCSIETVPIPKTKEVQILIISE